MRREVVVALCALSVLVLLVPLHMPDPPATRLTAHPLAVTPAQADAQLTGVATEELKRTQKFWQNGSGSYATASIPVTFPSNFTSGNYSSITSFSEAFYPVASGGLYAQVNETQGTTVLVNTTATTPFTISPTLSSTAVTQKVPELWTAANAVASLGTYSVTTAAVQTVSFAYNSPLNWSANSSVAYQTTYGVAAYRGYWLNQSLTFLPFPSLNTGVNWSTVTVLLNGTAYKDFQVVTGGVYVSIASIGPGYSASVTVKFNALPATSGAAPVLVVTTWNVLNATTNQINTSWTNQMSVAYAGEFIIQTRYPYSIDPSSVIVQAGLRVLPAGSWTLAGNTITIGPQVVTVDSGSAISFFVNFRFVNEPPAYHLTSGSVAFASGGGVVTWGEAVLALWLILGLGAVVVAFTSTKSFRGRQLNWDREHRFAITLAIAATILLAFWIYLEVQAGVTL